MKKISAAILIIILFLCQAVYADESYLDLTDRDMKELEITGIATGITKDDVSLLKVVTRGEFASLISNVMKSVSEGYRAEEIVFPDVGSEHEYFDEIMFVVKAGYMRGYSSGYFKPDAEIKRNEVIKTIVSMLGYDYLANAYGEYPTGYLTVARDLNLTKGITFDYDEYILKDEILKIMINALDAPVVSLNGVGDDGKIYETDNSKTLRTEYLDMYKKKGLITANEIVAIKGNTSPEGYITADGNLLLKITSNEYMDFIGLNTEFVYRYDEETGINELLLMYATDKNEVLKINKRDYLAIEAGTSLNTLKYEVDDLTETAKITKDAVYIKNGDLLLNPGVSEFENVVSGEITLISTDNTKNYNVVIIKSYKNMLVGSVNPTNFNVFAKYSSGAGLCLDPDDKKIIITDSEKNPVDLSYITPLSVITYAEGNNSIEVNVSKNILSGNVTVKDEKFWEIDGNEIFLAPAEATALNRSNVKYTAKCYLNFLGEIVYAENAAETGTVAYLMKAGKKSEGTEDSLVGKFYIPSENKIVTCDFSEKVTVDERGGITGADAVLNALGNIASSGEVVKIKFNDKNEVNYVDKPVLITDLLYTTLDGFCMSGRESYTYLLNSQSFNNMGYIAESTMFYNIPSDMGTNDPYAFTQADPRSPYMTNNANYDVNMYFDSKNDVYPTFVAAYTDTLSSISPYNYPAVFEKMTETVGEDGQKRYKVYYTGNKKASVELEGANTAGVTFFKEQIKPGEVFLFATRKDGTIANQKLVYDTTSGNVNGSYSSLVGNSQRIAKRIITEVTSDYITTTDPGGSGFERYLSGTFKIITVNQKKENGNVKSAIVEYGSFADVETGDEIVLYSRGGIHECIVVYK